MLDPIEYSLEEKEQISKKTTTFNFSGNNWSDVDILNLKKRIKSHYLSVQDYVCPNCRQVFRSNNGRYWDIDHIIARSLACNFMFEPVNLCMSCIDCNQAKSAKKVTSSNAVTRYPPRYSFQIFHPHFDNYKEHVIDVKPGFYYVAKTDKGEKTIEICKLNRFHAFARFGEQGDNSEEILLLAEQLRNAKNDELRERINKKIAALCIINVS